ncbi:cell division protein kinase-like protein [Hapsidospora chrysogenum ATCC 11550]|uniref:non-specific serine/threonine protein kinase n=1 Tax=Hapsidospora chrysogenum (strain ATCC 11550 / CBS 779.69 / DSM 880 / IAM 14645 / JCM 23072 / IMI 49137) TaxID=857340 RepID=A0A086T650_HAPC1|nr:cell division protein kinase-like protein [Hapsidospora chrysogenum ATCC 11550]
MLWVSEEVDADTGDFQYTMFATVDDDMIYYAQLDKPKAHISFQEATDSLARIPDDGIFPRWPRDLVLTKAPGELPPDVFIKRPRLSLYDVFLKHKVVHLIAKGVVEEAEVMEVVASQPHQNIIGYHGCHVRRGYITGLVLDRHPHDLKSYLESGHSIQNKELFMELLESAVHHLHSLGLAHNDLNPTNVLLAEDGRPILIDFGSARRIGDKLSTSRGTKGWISCPMEDYATSETQHDIFALAKLRAWLDNPTFED